MVRSKLCAFFAPLSVLAVASLPITAEEIAVTHPQGAAHGFVEVTTLEGTRIGVGDMMQKLHGDVVTSRLFIKFLDGSIDEETTVYSQRRVLHLISDHHVQRGPSFPKSLDATIDTASGQVTSTDPSGNVTRSHLDMPADVYNGLASGILMNISPAKPETKIAIVVASDKPRIVHLSMKNAGEAPFKMGGLARQAIDYVVHVEIGGVDGVVAPLVGKEPLDYHVLILNGGDPAFIRERGQLYEGGPVWCIQQISATFAPN
jgi:hypothetical protein